MPVTEIKHLFTFKRFPESELKIICLVLYIPVGLVLFILRAVLALGVVLTGCSADIPIVHKLVNKISCLALGISVTVENPEKKENVDVFVSNSLSIFDHLAVHSATGSLAPGIKMHPSLSRCLGIHYFGDQSNLDTFKKNVSNFIAKQKIPIHFTPEGKMTNGKALLKFKTAPFQFTNRVQPICISIERPLLDLSLTTLGSTYWIDILCYMVSPSTNYKLRYLPSLEKKSLSNEEFAEIVRQNIATALKIETPEFSASDLIEWEKRKLIEHRQQTQNVQRSRDFNIDPEIRRMASQVKEVLPHVPLNAIYRDLNKTRNVDSSITNILEGRVRFVPEQVSLPSTSKTEPKNTPTQSASLTNFSTNDRDLFKTAAPLFAKSAQDRSKSFSDRKQQLIANARQRYIEKNNLNI